MGLPIAGVPGGLSPFFLLSLLPIRLVCSSHQQQRMMAGGNIHIRRSLSTLSDKVHHRLTAKHSPVSARMAHTGSKQSSKGLRKRCYSSCCFTQHSPCSGEHAPWPSTPQKRTKLSRSQAAHQQRTHKTSTPTTCNTICL